MVNKIKKFSISFLKNNASYRKYYLFIGYPIVANDPIVLLFSHFLRSNGMLLIIPAIITFLIKLKKRFKPNEESIDSKMENSEIKEMLSYRYTSRVIVPIETINEQCISALRLAKSISNNITAFCICNDVESGEKIKQDFNLLNSDIVLVLKYSNKNNGTELLLEFIESPEYDYMNGDIITVLLPRFASKKYLIVSSLLQRKIYDARALIRHDNVVVMKIPK